VLLAFTASHGVDLSSWNEDTGQQRFTAKDMKIMKEEPGNSRRRQQGVPGDHRSRAL